MMFSIGLRVQITKIIAAVFARGPKRRNPTMTTSTMTARRKGNPQHMLGEKYEMFKKYEANYCISHKKEYKNQNQHTCLCIS